MDEDFEFSGDDLYYKMVKAEDVLIPYRVMHEREEKRLEIHSVAMVSLEEGSKEWEWRKELARRAHERSIVWGRLDRTTDSSD